jgi:hypothetical protein
MRPDSGSRALGAANDLVELLRLAQGASERIQQEVHGPGPRAAAPAPAGRAARAGGRALRRRGERRRAASRHPLAPCALVISFCRFSRDELQSDEARRGNWVAVDRDQDGRIAPDEFTPLPAAGEPPLARRR